MSIILKGIDLPEPIKDQHTYLELYVRSDGVVFDDDFDEVGTAIQIPKGHGRLIDASTETTVESMSGTAMDVGMLLIALKQYVPTIFGAEGE